MYKEITENGVKILVPNETKISKDLPVFYNPIMSQNRDVTISLLRSIKKPLQIGLPLAGSGVRAVRMLTELTNIQEIQINDNNPEAIKLIKKNIELNEANLNSDEIEIVNLDANKFLLESKGFDYIDIDPFGSPNAFLDNSIKRLARDGILAVTATDTGALAGSYPKACKRKYWARPLRDELMHETGVRILIRKIQLIGAQNDKALTPIISYSKDHYMRVFLKCEKGKEKVDLILKQHNYLLKCPHCLNKELSKFNSKKCTCKKEFEFAGPMYTGELQDKKILKKIVKNPIKENIHFLIQLEQESEAPFFYDIHTFAKKLKLKELKKTEDILKQVKKLDKSASLTHFKQNAIKTNINIKDFISIIK